MVSTKGIEKWKVLKALYDNAQPQGLGFLQYNRNPMTEEEAKSIIKEGSQYHNGLSFDYLKGRVMKVNLSDDDGFDERLYDRDNGRNAAERAINGIR